MKSFLKKKYFAEAISLLYIALFVYAAVSKLADFQNFRVQIAQSPLLTAFASFVAIAVIALEIIISVLLSFPGFKKFGLYASLALMTLFCLYIYMILTYSPFVPCSCGGILENMGWVQHLVFNIVFCFLAITGIYFLEENPKTRKFYIPIRVVTIAVGATLLMFTLYFLSEDSVHHNNDFVRRYPPFPAKRAKAKNLGFDSFYFAGKGNGKIYLGNPSAPALVTVIDTSLAAIESFRLTIKDTLFKFHNIQLRVAPPNFYLFDGTVPCVFKGNLTDRKAILQTDKLPGFTQAEVMDTNHLLIRSLSPKREHLLMKVNIENPLRRTSNQALLERQQDGIFDTDGTFHYDPSNLKMSYVYYYRNQYIVADDNLGLIARANTIDTTAKAKIKTEFVRKKKQRKFSAPPLTVNRITAMHKNLLFVNSTLPGKFDSKKMWNDANVVDVYDINDQSYLMSFYVYKVDGGQMNAMMADDDNLYVLMGTNIILYKLDKLLKQHFSEL